MHLKSHPKFVRTELYLDAVGVQKLPQQGALRRTSAGNHGNISSGRLPLGVISTNTFHYSNAPNHNNSSSVISSNVVSLRLKAPPGPALWRPVAPRGDENDEPRLYDTTPDDVDAPPDVLTVIKPGHVREKIAIFASDGAQTNSMRDGGHACAGVPASRDRKVAASINNALRALKAKGSWEEPVSPKRRRRSGRIQNLQEEQRSNSVLESQRHSQQLPPRPMDSAQTTGGESPALTAGDEEEQQKMSVVEMVAFLEQRANESQTESKPVFVLRRSSATIMLSRAPPPEVRGDEPETVKVSDMVAKLESECLKRKTEGSLSRTSSLRRTVGRLLLAAGDQVDTPCQPGPRSAGAETTACLKTPETKATASPLTTSPSAYLTNPLPPPSGENAVEPQEARGNHSMETQAPPHPQTPPPMSEEEEPLPGLLFLSPPLPQTDPPLTISEPLPLFPGLTFDLAPPPRQRRSAPAAHPHSDGRSEKKKRRRRNTDRPQEEDLGVLALPPLIAAPLCRRGSASEKFLAARHRLRQLLEPQPYLALLPHHLLVKVFLLLPTRALAALKCTCHNFRDLIDLYGVRPADSLWVSDPRYRDDPCKQCKKRYRRGDVSLCRWHKKPFCQALPYGPGYWMCCHSTNRDAPGCSVGLHDNRWVPAFHSMNAPAYRRNHCND
ncbi:F-box only protein 34 [Antennarius striatus]|uniref:F-box only protein 34 n=1 Tax=Antennarius striatus TaxID=241820 RepID=UPI0035B17F6A